MSFPCARCKQPVQQKLDRFDIRLEARRTDGNSRPNCKTVCGMCKGCKNELFLLIDQGATVSIDVVGDAVAIKVEQSGMFS